MATAEPNPPPAAVHTRLTPPGPWLQLLNLHRFEHNRYELAVPGLPKSLDGLRILHLSDLHFRRRWRGWHDELVSAAGTIRPDLVLITGDFVDSKRNHRPALPHVRQLLDSLPSRLGIYGIVGNHDGPDYAGHASGFAAKLIGGQTVRIPGEPIELIGLPGWDREDYPDGWERTVAPPTDGIMRVVLSHYPDHIRRVAALSADLFLAGHTHGGQVCLPGSIPIIKHDSLPRAQCAGVHRVNGTWLVVNRGFGYTGLPFRMFCPNEVIELVLRAG